jgi:DNA-directed RNA polymerase subunit RPC12/RpoP
MNQQRINIPLNKTTPIVCEECGSQAFQEALMLRRVSKFLTGDMKDGVMPVQTFVCSKCGHINKDFYPSELLQDEQE